jgi:hypothetical protein
LLSVDCFVGTISDLLSDTSLSQDVAFGESLSVA